MAQDDNDGKAIAVAHSSGADHPVGDSGLAVVSSDAFANPGFPPHHKRATDLDPAKGKRAARQVYTLFYLSIAGSVWAVAAYMLFPIESNNVGDVRMNTLFLGIGMTLALLGIGFGAVHWGKSVMIDDEGIDIRHKQGGSPET